MTLSAALEEYMVLLLAGDRRACRGLIEAYLDRAHSALSVYQEILWPAMERVDKLYRSDRIDTAMEHMATRINRVLADQVQSRLRREEPCGRRVVVTCALHEPEELGAQMLCDLLEARGWEVFFPGGGVPDDEILGLVGRLRPELLLIYGIRPEGVPAVRQLVDRIREIDAAPTMNIMTSGGVFNRAEGLWTEVNADLYARSAEEALRLAQNAAPRTPVPRSPGTPKKRRRRRRSLPLAAVGA